MYFNIFPRIVAEGQSTTIRVEPLYSHKKIKEEARYKLVHSPMETRGIGQGESFKRISSIQPKDGVFEFTLTFEGEQEHNIDILEVTGQEERVYCSFSVYSLKEDLYNLRPYKGDMHMHSHYSDGQESPAYVAAACRREGLDFMALTDHGQYKPSLEAQQAFENVEIDLKIYPGEEIHPPDNDVHMINFGGNFSVNELIEDQSETYFNEVEEIKEREKAPLSEEEQYKYASCKWCFDKIRQGGGLAIYCHPYWIHNRVYNVSIDLHNYIYEKQPYDAFELIGGFHIHEAESNHLQVTYYHEQRARGIQVPIVGVTDAHGCDNGQLFGWYYTIVFSQDLELPSLIKSIKDLKSVAVEALPGNPVRVYGPHRLVKYALFLIREVFPIHDELCREEGKLMLEFIAGNQDASRIMKSYKGRVARRMSKYWG